MSINKTYAVFGMGRYGFSLAKELVESGADVIAVDFNEKIISEVSSYIPICKCADVTDPDVIKQLGISNVDVVIVAMADSLEAAVLAVTLCKEAGVKTVIAKCGDEMQKKILSRVGADRVVFPEWESGTRLAKNLLSAGFIDMIELSRDVCMIEMDIKKEWIGKNLIDLKLRKKYSLNVVAIKEGEQVTTDIDPLAPLNENMVLIVIGNKSKFDKLN